MRQLLQGRLDQEREGGAERQTEVKASLLESKVAINCVVKRQMINTMKSPGDFYELTLGKHLKYSSCFWPDGEKDLRDAEIASLKMVAEITTKRWAHHT